MRASSLACLVAVLLMTQASTARAQQTVDTSQLPRVTGAKEVYASPATTIFTTTEPVPATADLVAKSLTAQGWQQYVPPYADVATAPNLAMLRFKKGPLGLQAMVTVAPAQNNATSVNYLPVPIAIDVPFPKDAEEIQFDPAQTKLIYKTKSTIDNTMDFFRTELVARYWSPWSTDENKRVANADKKTKKSGHAYYVHGAYRPIELIVQLEDDGRHKVTLLAFAAENLAALGPPRVAQEVKKAEVEMPKSPPTGAKLDNLADSIMKQVNEAVADAQAQAGGKKTTRPPVPPVAAKADEPVEQLTALADNPAPIPLPQTAQAIAYDKDNHTLEFDTASSVKQVAAFFRTAMKPLGWAEQRSVINQDNMIVLGFMKENDDLGIRIVQSGKVVKVYVNGEALAPPAAAPQPVAAADLEMEETAGLPVPKQHTMMTGEKGPFRSGADASVTAGLEAVLGFYRRELGKRDWKETKAEIKEDRAEVVYAAPEGPAILTLGRQGKETTVHLILRNRAGAEKSGLLAKAGQTKVLFGNITEQEASITINKKTVKVAAGAGTKGPDGPTDELAPGKYTFSSKAAGQAAKSDEIVIGADEVWALMIGPGGVLAMQMY